MKTLAKKYRVFLVDDHAAVRNGLARLLNLQPDLEVCGDAATIEEAKQAISDSTPDVVIVDLSISDGLDGLKLLKHLSSRYKHLRLLTLSSHSETIYAQRALLAGAEGYVMKHSPIESIFQAIRDVLHGKIYLSQEMKDLYSPRPTAGERNGQAAWLRSPQIEKAFVTTLLIISCSGLLTGAPHQHGARRHEKKNSIVVTHQDVVIE